jgi:benzoate membrane transport protein
MADMNSTPTALHPNAPPPAAGHAPSTLRHTVHDTLPAVLAGLIAVLISYAGPLLLVLQAGQAARLSPDQMASWVWAISIGAGVCGLWMSWRHQQPVICAWNTPGAALLVGGLAAVPFSQAVGAYLVAAAVMVGIGWSGAFERLMRWIPQSLCAAMLAGILLRFGTAVFAGAQSTVAQAPWLVAAMFAGYLVFKRRSARYAIVLTLLLGTTLWLALGWGSPHANAAAHAGASAPLGWHLLQPTVPQWTSPEWDTSAILSLGLPLLVLALTGQQMPGVAVMRAAGYTPPTSQLVAGTGWASLLMAPFGAHGVNLAAITAAICTGPEAHHQPSRRWVAGVACGAFYLLLGSFAGGLTQVFALLPPALVSTVAGLALLGAIQGGLVNAMAQPHEREAALVTFVVTASNVTLLGLGSACWGMALGWVTWWALKAPNPINPASNSSAH